MSYAQPVIQAGRLTAPLNLYVRGIMEQTQLQQQVLDELKNISRLYELAQGQISALRFALAACLNSPQMNTELRNQVQLCLETQLALLKQGNPSLEEADGFESALNQLLGNKISVHQPKGHAH